MTPEEFTTWLAAMKAAGLARSDAECGRLLGMSANSVLNLKKNGGGKWIALACAAVLAGIGPYNPRENETSVRRLD